ncbi:NADH-FMN oxidoreductase RutF, flavin reductase (DIM6/NTAB) family [Thalassobacillus cyri]|uniref:NADH-FMN oxidoreductase RutF, flavin reductase (DIM6/NTAB) family n=1 Tax=Thalassobacillus cyri TaxID=571932 RepID=A0A1H4GZJ2_9BACI|nr:flavin reductase family protein [Thalassobacillus cyri]SEB14896.1 NADH-FMN oxidoreductase RutF, flavin reductase (DIM6/NTAB) family [Thalassobacillus cyri]
MDIRAEDCKSKEAYKLLTGIVVPRPIAFVSSKDKNGIHNLAPFSFYTAITSSPPIIMFAIGERGGTKKDTLNNIESQKEFVINVVTEKIAVPMNDSSASFKSEVDEFKEVGLTAVPARRVDCMGVEESPIQLECELENVIPVGDHSHMVLGRVVHFHIKDEYYSGNFKINVEKLKPLARISGPNYARLDDYFSLEKTFDPKKIID